jgi:hypothetical protein
MWSNIIMSYGLKIIVFFFVSLFLEKQGEAKVTTMFG